MDNGAEERSAMMLFERNDLLVCDAFRNGDFDYVDAAGELSETDFFRAIAGKKILEKLAASYPSPAKKHEVPLWAYIASNISMRFHGVHQFHAYPYIQENYALLTSGGSVGENYGPMIVAPPTPFSRAK